MLFISIDEGADVNDMRTVAFATIIPAHPAEPHQVPLYVSDYTYQLTYVQPKESKVTGTIHDYPAHLGVVDLVRRVLDDATRGVREPGEA